MDRHAYQPPIPTVDLLPPPNLDDLCGIADLAADVLMLHAGKVASAAGGIFKPHPPDDGGDMLVSAEVPDTDGKPVPCVVLSFVSEEIVDEDVVVVEAGLDWEKAGDLVDEAVEAEADQDVGVISVLFNRRWSAHGLMDTAVYGFYELFESIGHEIGHMLDKEHTLGQPDYEDEKGQKANHKYVFDEAEVRARVWAALAVYSHVYLHATVGERWDEDMIKPPADSSNLAQWTKFVEDSPLGDMPLDEFNDDNRALFIEMLAEVAVGLRHEAEDEGTLPRILAPLSEARRLGAKIPDPCKADENHMDEAARVLASHCLKMWDESNQER